MAPVRDNSKRIFSDFDFAMSTNVGKALNAFETQNRSPLDMCIMTQCPIFAIWEFIKPRLKVEPYNL